MNAWDHSIIKNQEVKDLRSAIGDQLSILLAQDTLQVQIRMRTRKEKACIQPQIILKANFNRYHFFFPFSVDIVFEEGIREYHHLGSYFCWMGCDYCSQSNSN